MILEKIFHQRIIGLKFSLKIDLLSPFESDNWFIYQNQ